MDKPVLLAAGGTGGHLFPAEALAHELVARGYCPVLVTDKRAERFTTGFPADSVHVVASATLSSKNPLAVLRTGWALFRGYRQSANLVRKIKPLAAVGFGGYPTVPPMVAATSANVPAIVHEQNAILGRANRMLAPRVKLIATGFRQVGKATDTLTLETGNPVRPTVLAVEDVPYPERSASDALRLVIFGGSQGARFFSEAMPPALALLSKEQRARLSIVQQAREEDEAALKAAYEGLGIKAGIAPFFTSMPEEVSRAHFVIARAGASSVTELAVIGRPSLLVPLPESLDGDQAANAIAMAEADGAYVVKQAELDAERISGFLQLALDEPGRLSAMAANARKTGIADAAGRLADCVECVISGGDLNALKF
ncbi:UDP-N-acetylglucosamine--N-acetylmuramyl-(pentapeptide) pyrophosphoryl-undecaprenol N-acetylglucosamine transferase [Salaquimonas pukyongi]|uniref:UDP-N-acetylglucosamine--N-acetylmuramyl- (pentapeptide) pyrophosphoryl-undecaprenol N-acetylglucosamine transferase n=1 Tax=Salaquimonas pukyongi TaxID=2712698 RepID=UPI00096BA625|nr:UDP-N-acetylglucosamine--N-acetylmuramyl-(pentapeptide) pyrophosphoryl-undecaprenol N-acetylglucosamine transferase [Salaquimonas pukyongi]